MRIYNPLDKPRGLLWLKRKFAIIGDDLIHGTMRVSARGSFEVRRQIGVVGTVSFDARESAFLAFVAQDRFGGYEPLETMFIEAMLAKARVFYDVGANWGYFTLLAATHPTFDGPIWAFDLLDRMNDSLSRMKRTLRLETVHVAGYGLSDTTGTAAASRESHAHLTQIVHKSDPASVEVAVRRLDEVDCPPPDLIKIDVEDHEIAVLQGGLRVLRESKPTVLFESRSDSAIEHAGQVLGPVGYSLYTLNRGNGEGVALRRIDPGHCVGVAPANLVAVAEEKTAHWLG